MTRKLSLVATAQLDAAVLLTAVPGGRAGG